MHYMRIAQISVHINRWRKMEDAAQILSAVFDEEWDSHCHVT